MESNGVIEMDGLNFHKNGTVTDLDGEAVGTHNGFEITELFERAPRYNTLEGILEALQTGIYGNSQE
jgi:hypothetical protein